MASQSGARTGTVGRGYHRSYTIHRGTEQDVLDCMRFLLVMTIHMFFKFLVGSSSFVEQTRSVLG